MRLPARCFLDFNPGGCVCRILEYLFEFKSQHKWESFNFQNNDLNIELLKGVLNKLIELKFFRQPTAFIRPEIDNTQKEKIVGILKEKYHCEITLSENEASHIIYPETSYSPNAYARPTFKQGNHVMIHWYYFPDSYNSWVPNTFDLPVSTTTQIG